MATTYLAGDVRPANTTPTPTDIWHNALANCRDAQAAVYGGITSSDDATERYAQAIDRLVLTPAPDQPALALKLEFMACSFAAFAIESMMLAAVVEDARRLLVEG